MKNRNINALKGFLVSALLALHLSSSAYAAVSLDEALDTVGTLSWTTTNVLNWSGQTGVTHDGVDAAASPTLTNNNSLAMFQTFVTGPGTVSYWWKVSSETNGDRLVFTIDGTEQGRISGEVDWQSRSFAVSSGSHLLRFVYQKNGGNTAGQDRAWVDQVQFSGSALVVTCSSNKTVPCGDPWSFDPPTGAVGCGGSNVSVQVMNTVTNNFAGACSYQSIRTWQIVDACSNQTTCTQTVTIVDTNPPCTYVISPTNAAFGSASATGIVSVTTAAGCAWNVINTNGWVSILSGASGSGSGSVLYTVAANSNATTRTGNLLIANQPFTITQSGTSTGGCTYALSPGSASFSSVVSTGLVSVAAPGGCAWTAMSTNPWIVIAAGTNGSGSGTVRYDVAANTSANPRNGNLLVAGQIFPVSQLGTSNGPITLEQALDTEGTPLVWTTGGSGSSGVFVPAPWFAQTGVSHDGIDAAESGSTPDTAYSYVSTTVTGPGTVVFWWKVSSATNSDRLSLYINGTEQTHIWGEVDWTQRTFTVPAGSQSLQWRYVKDASGSAGQDRGWLDQVQYTPDSATNCYVTISPTNRVHGPGTSGARVDVYLPEGCFWGFANSNAWITTVIGVGYPGFVDYTVAANPNSLSRTGIMVIGGNLYTVTQLGATNVTCTYSVSPTNRIHGYGAASNSITLNTSAGCNWSLINTNPWISFPVTSGNGSAMLSYFVTANSSASPRSGYISIANRLVFITQNGASGGGTNTTTNCIIALSPMSRSHDSLTSTGTVTVSAPSTCPWNVSETNSWITITSGLSSGGNGTVTYVITANPNAVGRTGYINIGGQIFTVAQSGNQPLSTTPVIIPAIVVTNIGHIFFGANGQHVTNGTQSGSLVQDFLIDQDHTSGGGMELPNVSVNWDTNFQFTMTVSAPAGMKLLVDAPTGSQVRFDGFLWWESTRGGFSPAGTASVQFAELEGIAPGFSGASPFLSSSHGFFGFSDLEGTPVSNTFSFVSITLSASLVPQFTGNGTENYIPHLESALHLSYVTSSTNDPGPFVSIVPGGPLPFIQTITALPGSGVDITVYGNPGRTHIVQCSGDTVNWTQIASAVMPQTGSMKVRDVNGSKTSGVSGGSSSRFYRVVEVRNVLPTD